MRTAHMAAALHAPEPGRSWAAYLRRRGHYADAPVWGEVSEVSDSLASVAA
jgi:hypothetical protein